MRNGSTSKGKIGTKRISPGKLHYLLVGYASATTSRRSSGVGDGLLGRPSQGWGRGGGGVGWGGGGNERKIRDG